MNLLHSIQTTASEAEAEIQEAKREAMEEPGKLMGHYVDQISERIGSIPENRKMILATMQLSIGAVGLVTFAMILQIVGYVIAEYQSELFGLGLWIVALMLLMRGIYGILSQYNEVVREYSSST